jgi:hypothetical protein
MAYIFLELLKIYRKVSNYEKQNKSDNTINPDGIMDINPESIMDIEESNELKNEKNFFSEEELRKTNSNQVMKLLLFILQNKKVVVLLKKKETFLASFLEVLIVIYCY